METELEAARLRASGHLNEVATLVISAYGPEVLGFLVTLSSDRADAGDAFAQACEDLWRGLPRFEGRSSLKTWFYTLARHALSRQRRAPDRRRKAPLSELSDVAACVRSETAPHLRSEVVHGVAAIREALPQQDRALLVLRVDRDMPWDQIARVMSDVEIDTDADCVRIAARLRKRFQTIKETIRTQARALGLAAMSVGAK
jgi:RNA polymerase sigma-70 factor (ECF subfamily)